MACLASSMTRDLELIRHLLLAIEEAPTAELLRPPAIVGYAQVMVDHHVRLLIEAGLAVAAAETRNPRGWLALRLSWAGHEYLDTIRDPLIWRYTHRAARRVGGWSLDTIGAIAKAALLARAQAAGMVIAA